MGFLGALAVGLVALVYYFVISADYARQGVAWADGLLGIHLPSIPLFLGIIAGGIAFRRGLHAEVSRG
jgi:cell division protein FtsX